MYLKLEERESQIILERDYMFNKVKGQVTKIVQRIFSRVEEHMFFQRGEIGGGIPSLEQPHPP